MLTLKSKLLDQLTVVSFMVIALAYLYNHIWQMPGIDSNDLIV